MDYGVIMIIKKGLTKILTAVREVVDDLSKNYIEYEYDSLKENKKDYKYKTRPHDEWDEILKGNDYY